MSIILHGHIQRKVIIVKLQGRIIGPSYFIRFDIDWRLFFAGTAMEVIRPVARACFQLKNVQLV